MIMNVAGKSAARQAFHFPSCACRSGVSWQRDTSHAGIMSHGLVEVRERLGPTPGLRGKHAEAGVSIGETVSEARQGDDTPVPTAVSAKKEHERPQVPAPRRFNQKKASPRTGWRVRAKDGWGDQNVPRTPKVQFAP